jgi:hypothetical protein
MARQEELGQQLSDQRRKVDFDTLDVMIQQLTTMVASGSIDVAPAYQRQFRWDPLRRSHLIESLLLGIPVPSLFMATNRDSTWELVDGVQRLSTIVQFAGSDEARVALKLDGPLRLEGLDKLTSFNGKTFADLPQSIQLHFEHRPVKIVTLTDKSDEVVRFDLFERLNTGGVTLTDQEIRACIFRGEFNNYLEKCAVNSDFNAVVLLTERQRQDGTREEFVLRFFAFLNRYKAFDHSVVEFLTSYMKDASKSFDYNGEDKIFVKTFQQLRASLPRGIVRTPTRKITPVNLFEAVSVGAALALRRKSSLVSAGAQKWIGSEQLRKLTTGATNTNPMVIGRVEYCRNKFLGE